MNPEESALLTAILANPGDDLPRLVLADWLDEHDRPERAEFVRVQVELAAVERRLADLLDDDTDWDQCTGVSAGWCPNCGDCVCRNPEDSLNDADCPLHSPNSDHCCKERAERERDALRKRERELWLINWKRWFGWACGLPAQWVGGVPHDTDLVSRECAYVVRRGFVSEVRCTLAPLFGGPCPGCIEPGELDDGDSRCRLCKGSGHTPGIAADLFASQPVEKVSLTDLTIWPSGGNDTYYLGGVSIFPAKYWRRLEGLPSRLAVKSEAESVCVEWGRELAGLALEGCRIIR